MEICAERITNSSYLDCGRWSTDVRRAEVSSMRGFNRMERTVARDVMLAVAGRQAMCAAESAPTPPPHPRHYRSSYRVLPSPSFFMTP
ncbi:hypothetical protein EVAR_50317_1 [Eumeta japonica]|uniref:Uncharacterized protein n=1 Tax=Eumeta variegata TaxID=151549 RepID=A0A4C2A362_EUMVA|nr:hypothetical protein EVAR_50317_1 [Eumeta japonica]